MKVCALMELTSRDWLRHIDLQTVEREREELGRDKRIVGLHGGLLLIF